MKQSTQAIHGRSHSVHPSGAVNQPVFYSSTFKWSPEEGVRYIRFGNTPNQELTGELLAALEKVDTGTVAASGQASIASALMTALKTGDHLLVTKGLYGGTVDVVRKLLPRLGVSCTEIDPFDRTSWKNALQPTTRALYCESLTSPLCRVPLLDELSTFAQDNALLSMIDNTNPGATNLSPTDIGFDVIIHSLTKYIGGHSDLVGGCVLGGAEFVEAARSNIKLFGAALDPHSCFLVQRGLKSLDARMSRHNENALTLARHLEKHSAVRKVHYPGLPALADHQGKTNRFRGYGALVTFDLAEVDAPIRITMFLENLRLPIISPSFGGPETLVVQPTMTTQVNLSEAEQREMQIGPNTVRVAVGLEDAEDLIADFDQALNKQ